MKTKRMNFPIVYALIILITAISFAFTMSKSISLKNQKMNILSENKDAIIKLNNEISQLQREIKNADTLEFVEKVARDDLGMVKPREIVYIDKNKMSSDNNLNEQYLQEDK